VDALIAPVAPMPAPTIAESDVGGGDGAEAVIQRITRFTRPFNYLGLPSMSIPCGFDLNGLPIGLQMSGRPFAEAAVLQAGDAYQRDTDWHARRPAIAAV
jgi:aspartyl-tRNA(Asn)/glutamyl-tRNA(Gln) amidotransferase subunit A